MNELEEILPISILFAEDEEIVREYVKKMLERRVKKLYLAEDGRQGLNIYMEKKPDIVITDIRMPDMDGLSMAKAIKDMNKDTQIIVMSAHSDAEYLLEVIELGFNGYLVKPIKKKKLLEEIEKCCEIIRAKKELARKSILINTLMNVYPYPVYVKDNNCRFTMNNKAGKIMFGNVEDDFPKGKTDVEIFGEELGGRYVREEQEIIRTGKPLIGREEEFISSNGEKKWQLITKVPLKDETGNIKGIVGFNIDITEQKEMNLRLEKSREEAEKANNSKDDFLAKMSHELRTPMNSIIGLSEVLLEEEDTDEKRKSYLSLINNSANSLLNMINEILDFSRIQSGNMRYIDRNTDIRSVFEAVAAEYEIACDKKGILFERYYDEINMPNLIKIDVNRIRQILNNLLGNALKFTSKGFVKLELLKEIGKDSFVLSVSDSGIGIPKDKQKEIFDSFRQGDDSISENYGGTGLGLAITKSIVEHYGGEIAIESSEGNGSEFRVTIPYEIGGEGENAEKNSQENTEISIPERLRILLAEDDEISRIVFSAMLERYEIDLFECDNGRTAFESFKKKTFDLIFLDVQMPVMNGLDTARMMREYEMENNLEKTPIIGLSAHAYKKIIDRCLDSGMDDYLIKPYHIRDLVDKIQKNTGNDEREDKSLEDVKPFTMVENEDLLVIDIDRLCEELRIEKDLLVKLLNDYVGKFYKILSSLWEAVDKKDFAAINRLTHGLKGTTGMFTNKRAYESLLALEREAKNENGEKLTVCLKSFEDEVNSIRDYLNKIKS